MKEEVEPAIAFCEVLRQQRITRGLTHKTLGLRTGLPGKYIYDLENHINKKTSKYIMLVLVLSVIAIVT